MEIELEEGKTIRGITLAETGGERIFVENEDHVDKNLEYNHTGKSTHTLQQIIQVKRCQSITIQGEKVEEDAKRIPSNKINSIDTFETAESVLDLTDVESAEQVSENSVEVQFKNGSTETISGQIQCAYVYF